MEKEKLNLVELLKDAPKGTKLYSPVCGECELEEAGLDIDDTYHIAVRPTSNGRKAWFTLDGRCSVLWDGECLLFPSKDQRDWSKFKVREKMEEVVTLHPGDKILLRDDEDYPWVFSFLSHVWDDNEYCYCTVGGCNYKHCIPYNISTRDLLGTTAPCPINYKLRF